ncbi:unnamed protein product [Dicrocoelium dendriticum]|nr:unnamed protein product [Dicrocoelium dendriticum]
MTKVQFRVLLLVASCTLLALLCLSSRLISLSKTSWPLFRGTWWHILPGSRSELALNDLSCSAYHRRDQNCSQLMDFCDFFCLLSKFGLILAYFYICDRTQLFHSINKGFSSSAFWSALLLLLFLGLLLSSRTKQLGINHVDITREWKGWMQLYILVYHYIDGYSVQVPYFLARWCVSAYLFLSGFGHFCYFWRRSTAFSESDCSGYHNDWPTVHGSSFWIFMKRYIHVMFRMNFLVVALCLMMSRNYMMYYFVPLVSFWFTVVALVMAIYTKLSVLFPSWEAAESRPCLSAKSPTIGCATKRSVNAARTKYCAMLVLFAILWCCIELLHRVRQVFHVFFHTGLFGYLLTLDDRELDKVDASISADNRSEGMWYFRWSLDRYSTLFGMCFGFLYELTHQAFGARSNQDVPKKTCHSVRVTTIPDNQAPTSASVDAKHWFSRIPVILEAITTSVGIASLTILLFYITKVDRTIAVQNHPYMCIFPILAYILARNGFRYLRSWHSKFFAWFGDISLELFVGQYHIWLAQDAHGLLVFVPGLKSLNLLLTTTTFVVVCHELHALTGKLQTYIIPKTPDGLVSRGVVLCLLVVYFCFP